MKKRTIRLFVAFLIMSGALATMLAPKQQSVEMQDEVSIEEIECLPCYFWEELLEADGPLEIMNKLVGWILTANVIFGFIFALGAPVYMAAWFTIACFSFIGGWLLFRAHEWWMRR